MLAQDRRLLESSQPWYDAEGDAFERSVGGDAPTLLARRVIELARLGHWEEKRDALPRSKRFHARV